MRVGYLMRSQGKKVVLWSLPHLHTFYTQFLQIHFFLIRLLDAESGRI